MYIYIYYVYTHIVYMCKYMYIHNVHICTVELI